MTSKLFSTGKLAMRRANKAIDGVGAALQGVRDAARLERHFPQLLAQIRRSIAAEGSLLRPAYEEYVESVSTPDMAISLELAGALIGVCEHSEPRRVVDLGSGFSSFALRSWAARTGYVGVLVSVDDNEDWLRRTEAFLMRHQLPPGELVTWKRFLDSGPAEFDVILHDLGSSMQTRQEELPRVMSHLSDRGFLVLDDVHKPRYAREVRRVVEASDLNLLSLRRETRDGYGRFAAIATPSSSSSPPC